MRVWFLTNQYLESAFKLITQIATATCIFSSLSCIQTHISCRLSVSRFTRWFGVFLVSLSLAHSSTPPCRSLVIHNISLANAYLFPPLRAQLMPETTRGYCWRLVFLCFSYCNPLQIKSTSVLIKNLCWHLDYRQKVWWVWDLYRLNCYMLNSR